MDAIVVPSKDTGTDKEDAIDVVAIRRARLQEWFAGRALPVDRQRYLSALINGRAGFGERAARGLEGYYGMPKGHLDGPLMDKALTLGDRIKQCRKAQGLTQQQLAEVGVTQPAIAALETGKRAVPKGDNLLRLAEVLGVTADKLIGISSGATRTPWEEDQLLAAFRALSTDKQLVAIKLVEALR